MSVDEVSEPRIIVVTECGFLARENGSHHRIYDQLRFLARAYPDRVILYSFHEHVEYPWTAQEIGDFAKHFPDVRLVLDHRTKTVVLAQRIRNAMLALFPGHARKIAQWRVPGTPEWRVLQEERGNDIYMLNFVDLVTMVNGLPEASLFIETHDIKSFKAAKALGAHPSSLRIVGKFRSETAALSLADGLIAISPHEASTFRSISPGPKVFYVPLYQEMIDPPRDPSGQFTYDLLFVGADNNFNVDGLVGFVEAHAEWLRDRSLAVAGNVCVNAKIEALAARNPALQLLGFVSDLAPLYLRSKAVVSPVEGTGLKIKVVEALAHGKPVFGSQHSRDGLPPGAAGAVFPLEIAQVENIIDNAERLAVAGRAAEAYYRTFFSVGDIGQLRDFLCDLPSRR